RLKIYDAASGQEMVTFRKRTRALPSPVFSVQTLAFSPDGTRLAGAGEDKTVWVWDAVTGREIRALTEPTDQGFAVAFSADGKWLAAGADKTVRTWDTTSGQQLSMFEGHTDWVFSVAFSPNGKRLASASADKTVKIWDTASGQETLTLKGRALVMSVAFS